jgi:4-hydroxybenzoate polyprenyltransferase
MTIVPPIVRLVHPGPAIAVIVLGGVLGAVLQTQAGRPLADARLLLTVVAVAGSQVLTGALNDWADRARDAVVQPSKPIPSGLVMPRTALILAAAGASVQLAASIPLGPAALAFGLVASASAVAYDLWLSRQPASAIPYVVSFSALPLWIASGVGVSPERVAVASLVAGPFAAAAHLANAVRDFDADARVGARNLAQVLGRALAFRLAWGVAMAVAIGVGGGFALHGRLGPVPITLGAIGLGAVAAGARSPGRLWSGILVAAVAWTAAWAIGSG